MASTFTTNKGLERPGNGDYVDTWNIPVNADMTVIDTALGGVLNLNATAGNAVLTTSQYQNLIINVTGAMSANTTYTIPSGVGGQWIVRNATTDSSGGPWSVIFASGGGGTTVSAVRGKNITIWSDGTNIYEINFNITTTGTGAVVLQTSPTLKGEVVIDSTGEVQIPVGTTGERSGSPAMGMIRYNTTISQYEGYGSAWKTFNGASGGGPDQVFYLNGKTVTTNYAIPSNQNAMSTGPISVNSGVTITVPSGSKWVVL